MCAWADLGLRFLHMPEGTFLHGGSIQCTVFIPSYNELARGYRVCPVPKYVTLASTFIDGF